MSIPLHRVLLPVMAMLAAACASGPGPSPVPPASSAPSAPSSSAPSNSPSSFSLLLWQSNGSISPSSYLPGSMPQLAIADGVLISGLVAIPMIYPGPLYISPEARPLSAAGQTMVISALRTAGLLANLDFVTPPIPGASLLHLRVSLDGITYETVGYSSLGDCANASLCPANPGTAQAVADLVTRLSFPDSWLSDELGPSSQYAPAQLAVRLIDPTQATGPMLPMTYPWPLAASFAQISAAGSFDCVSLGRADTALLLPLVTGANILARFTDSDGAVRSIAVRAIFPGEDATCPALAEK
jgi:hypothetical protein